MIEKDYSMISDFLKISNNCLRFWFIKNQHIVEIHEKHCTAHKFSHCFNAYLLLRLTKNDFSSDNRRNEYLYINTLKKTHL